MTKPKTILLWGDTQVGKTTLLACAFYHGRRFPQIAWRESADSINMILGEHWQRLKDNRWVLATAEKRVDLLLTLNGGGWLQISDVQGGLTGRLGQIPQQLKSADAVLFFVDWTASEMGRQMAAIETAWNFVMDLPTGLVFTRCERGFAADDPAWKADRHWWRTGRWAAHNRVIERFGDSVWPTSAYGYAGDTRLPAMVLGEFGELLPYRITPKRVQEPFEWIFKQLKL